MRVLSLLGAIGALRVLSVSAQDVPADLAPCMSGCVEGTKSKFAEFGCVEPAQVGCLCVNQNFQFSVRDCSLQTCRATEEQAFGHLFDTFCIGQPSPSGEAPSSTEAPATTDSTTAAATTATTTEAEDATTATDVDEPSTTEAVSTTASPTDVSTTPISTDEASTTSEASSTRDAETSATGGTESDQNEEDEDEGEAAGGGLSQGAAVGIGIGVAVIVIAIIVVAVVIFLRRKRSQQPVGESDLSRPMPPASAGSYPPVDHGAYMEKDRGGESIEMQTNRYEDMPPRQTPRVMV